MTPLSYIHILYNIQKSQQSLIHTNSGHLATLYNKCCKRSQLQNLMKQEDTCVPNLKIALHDFYYSKINIAMPTASVQTASDYKHQHCPNGVCLREVPLYFMTKYGNICNKTHLHMMVIGWLPVLLYTLFTSSISFSTVVGEDGLSCSGHSV